MWERSLLASSGQAWSFWLGTALLLASLTGYVGAYFSGYASAFLWVLFTAMGATLSGFWFLFGHPRCPACRLRWVFYIASRADSEVAFARVLETETCPRCGFPNRTPRLLPDGP